VSKIYNSILFYVNDLVKNFKTFFTPLLKYHDFPLLSGRLFCSFTYEVPENQRDDVIILGKCLRCGNRIFVPSLLVPSARLASPPCTAILPTQQWQQHGILFSVKGWRQYPEISFHSDFETKCSRIIKMKVIYSCGEAGFLLKLFPLSVSISSLNSFGACSSLQKVGKRRKWWTTSIPFSHRWIALSAHPSAMIMCWTYQRNPSQLPAKWAPKMVTSRQHLALIHTSL
jgi:hypothetical protein